MSDERNTFLQLLDPRTKFFALILVGAQTFFLRSPWIIVFTAIVVVIGVVLSPITIRMLVKQIPRVFWFVLFITIVNTFTVSGKVLFEYGEMYGTYEGLREGLLLSARIVLLLLLSYLFVQTTSITEMLDGTEAMLSPFRRRIGTGTLLLSLTLNFVPLIIQSAQRIKAAQIARGADVDSSFLRQVRFASAAALPLFVSAFRSSQHLAEAMEARCYDATANRTPFSKLKMNVHDRATLLFLLILFVALICLQ